MTPRRANWIWGAFALVWLLVLVQTVRTPQRATIAYSEFREALARDRILEVVVSPTRVHGKLRPGEGVGEGAGRDEFESIRVEDATLLADLQARRVRVTGEEGSGRLAGILSWLLPGLLLLGFFTLLLRRAGGGSGTEFMTIGRSKARVYMEKEVKVGFADVAGVDEAKEELHEVIEFLQTPEKFRRLGGRVPKGILLVGPPGTGKTLLARAVAGEAGVPFFSISGSEFVELFVGVGAARVRDLFTQAKGKAPCIIFIDELDALGKVRGVGPMAHEEREQTLNQLLVELDGFDPRTGVILMAATNRPEILDPALLRAGRFDRHVLVDRPDRTGRMAILQVHARSVKLGAGANLEAIAAMTAGLVGADLANVINEAALLAVRRGAEDIAQQDLQEAVERIVAGLEKRSRVLNRLEKERVAHHEIGHALIALSIPGCDAVQKISIIPRGIAALGYTLQLPTEDRFLMTQGELENKIAVLLGGRVAEEIVYGELSTGAQDDLRKATQIAEAMVRAYGMSGKLGDLSLERERQPLFMNGGMAPVSGEHGEAVLREVDAEVRRILDEQHARASRMLRGREALLREAAALLLARETLSGDELSALAARPVEAAVARAS